MKGTFMEVPIMDSSSWGVYVGSPYVRKLSHGERGLVSMSKAQGAFVLKPEL